MRDHEDRDAHFAVEAADQLHDFVRGCAVEVSRWLVGEEGIWFGHDGACDGNALLLSAGEFRRCIVEFIREADGCECFYGLGVSCFFTEAAVKQWQFDIFEGACAREQIETLEDEAQGVASQEGTLVGGKFFDTDAFV